MPGVLGEVVQSASLEPARSPWRPALVFVQVGGGEATDSLTAGLQWVWPAEPIAFAGGSLRGNVELAIGHWESHHARHRHAVSTQIGIAPAMRFTSPRWPRWFADAALGFNAITPIFRDGLDDFSTIFNFSEHIGIGYRPQGSRWEWALRIQHFSNGGIREPNPGRNFVQLRLNWLL